VSTKPQIVVRPSLEALSREAAARLQRLAAESIAAAGRFSVALSGGSTPLVLYRLLAEASFREAIDWSRVHLFWGDERFVPARDPDSNYGAAREAFVSRVPIPADNVHPILTDTADPETAAAQYEDTLRRFFSLSEGEMPRFDLILLGLGPEGHTASLFPGSAALDENKRPVVATYVPKLAAWRVTLTPPVLRCARNVMFLVAGPDKATVLRGVFEGPYDPHSLPAQLVRPEKGNLTWLVDEAAASLLSAGLKGR
jgi:6-phosphogluconolactonase